MDKLARRMYIYNVLFIKASRPGVERNINLLPDKYKLTIALYATSPPPKQNRASPSFTVDTMGFYPGGFVWGG